jgi:hypothetical protein
MDDLGETAEDATGATFLVSEFTCAGTQTPIPGAPPFTMGGSLSGGDVANSKLGSQIDGGLTQDQVKSPCLQSVKGIFNADAVTDAPPRDLDENYLMTLEAKNALLAARAVLQATPLIDYDIWVTGAWDSSLSHHSQNRDPTGEWDAPRGGIGPDYTGRYRDRHYYGAAVDMVLCKRVNGTCPADGSTKTYDDNLGTLASILATDSVGFDWVWWEPNHQVCGGHSHIHASISSPSLDGCMRCRNEPLAAPVCTKTTSCGRTFSCQPDYTDGGCCSCYGPGHSSVFGSSDGCSTTAEDRCCAQ